MGRLRIRFTKLGKVRWTSHRDVARMWERAFRRAQLPVAYSAGFSPRPRVSFGLALPTGHESEADYDIRDVPYIQYFHEGYALHGAFWHDDFGKVHSHGCVNLAPADAAWLFEWTDPVVPPEWHGAVSGEAGTEVWVHG